MSGRELISPKGHAPARGAYASAVKVALGDGAEMLFVTGQLARAADGSIVAPGDVGAQTEFIFQLNQDILAAAGMDFSHVVRVQTYLTNMADFPRYRAVRDRWLDAFRPASTLIEVKGLAHPECVVELEITAVKSP